MNLNAIFNNYLNIGYSSANAMAKTCQDIILYRISNSNLNRNVTIKGGVVMHSISKDKRRATQDLDIDFIRYSLDDSAILAFVEKLSDKDIKIKIISPIKKLHHQDYDGKRVFIEISDNFGNVFPTKLDIGVHKNIDIKQEEICFDLNAEFNSVHYLLIRKNKYV